MNKSFVESDIITADFYETTVCDRSWGGEEGFPDDKSVIFCPNEAVWRIFDLLNFHKPDRKYILVSGYSDYGVWYQQEAHPNKDIAKRFGHVQLDQIEKIVAQYCKVELCGATENCRPEHKFSLKIDSLTGGTFESIPPQIVRWYCANLNIEEDRVFAIPFGMNQQGHGKDIVRGYYKTPSEKSKLLYVNFQDYTYDRINLKNHYKYLSQGQTWLTAEPICNRKIEDFYEDLSSHMFVLCPFGNGLDCYRIYETLAVGSVPIIKDCRWARNLTKWNLPVVLVDNLFGLNYNILSKLAEESKSALLNQGFRYETITKGFWYNEINDARALFYR